MDAVEVVTQEDLHKSCSLGMDGTFYKTEYCVGCILCVCMVALPKLFINGSWVHSQCQVYQGSSMQYDTKVKSKAHFNEPTSIIPEMSLFLVYTAIPILKGPGAHVCSSASLPGNVTYNRVRGKWCVSGRRRNRAKKDREETCTKGRASRGSRFEFDRV